MTCKYVEALPAHMTSLELLVQEHKKLQTASTMSPDSGHSIFYTNGYTVTLCPDYDSFGWNLGDEETTVCPANLHAEAPQSLAIDSPFLPDLVNSSQEDPGFDWSSEVKIPYTIDQGFHYEFEDDDECSWLEISKYIDASVFDGDGPQDSLWIAPQSSSRNSIQSEDPYKHAAENTTHNLSTLANSTPCTSPPFSETENHDTPHSISSESQTPAVDNSQTILKKATEDIEVIDLTGDDLHASPEPPYPEPTDHSSNCIAVKQPLIFVDLTQDDDSDDDDDKVDEWDKDAETWHDGNCDNIDYDYRSPYENKTRSMTPVVGSSHSRNPSNLVESSLQTIQEWRLSGQAKP